MRKPFLLLAALFFVSGCSARRYVYSDHAIESYDYAVIDERNSAGYIDEAERILGESFILIEENDPRLSLPAVRSKTCEVIVNWSRGFWSTTGWVEVADYESGDQVLITQTRRGVLWVGAEGDVLESLRDLASARAEGPPLPSEAEQAAVRAQASMPPGSGASSVEARLSELKDLYERGVITENEYKQQRKAILGSM